MNINIGSKNGTKNCNSYQFLFPNNVRCKYGTRGREGVGGKREREEKVFIPVL
jgi:hypothetical protein